MVTVSFSYLGLLPLPLWFALCLLSILPELSKAVLIQPPAFMLSKQTICQNIKAKSEVPLHRKDQFMSNIDIRLCSQMSF